MLVTGEHDICRADTEQAAALLGAKGIPHSLHVWGNGSEHDWPEWRKMAAVYFPDRQSPRLQPQCLIATHRHRVSQ